MSADVAGLRRALNDPCALVAALGLDAGAKRQPRGMLICCPFHIEVHPSCSVTVRNDATIGVVCFACGTTGDALTLIAVAFGLDTRADFRRVLEEAARLVGYDLPRASSWRRTA